MRKVIFITVIFILIFPLLFESRVFGTSAEEQPSVVSAVAPAFPPVARAARQQGDVIVEVKVDAKGNVQSAKAVSGSALLRKASEMAAKKWKFVPAAGELASRTVKLTFNYGYADGDKSEPEYIITFIPPYKIEVKWNPPSPTY